MKKKLDITPESMISGDQVELGTVDASLKIKTTTSTPDFMLRDMMPINTSSWRCGGCGTWHKNSIESCKCSEGKVPSKNMIPEDMKWCEHIHNWGDAFYYVSSGASFPVFGLEYSSTEIPPARRWEVCPICGVKNPMFKKSLHDDRLDIDTVWRCDGKEVLGSSTDSNSCKVEVLKIVCVIGSDKYRKDHDITVKELSDSYNVITTIDQDDRSINLNSIYISDYVMVVDTDGYITIEMKELITYAKSENKLICHTKNYIDSCESISKEKRGTKY